MTFSDRQYAFLYRTEEEPNKFVVIIAKYFVYTQADISWMIDEEMGKYVLVPNLDIEAYREVFESEEEAVLYIAKWWAEWLQWKANQTETK